MSNVVAESHSEEARFTVGTYKRPGPALELTLRGENYLAHARVPAGYADNATIRARIEPPGRPLLVTACIANRGRRAVALYAAADAARSRALLSGATGSSRATPALGFWEARPVSIRDRLGTTVDRMATFRGFLGHTWIVWMLLVLFLAGLPLGVGAALWRGLAD